MNVHITLIYNIAVFIRVRCNLCQFVSCELLDCGFAININQNGTNCVILVLRRVGMKIVCVTRNVDRVTVLFFVSREELDSWNFLCINDQIKLLFIDGSD